MQSAAVQPLPAGSIQTRPLWAAVSVLGVAVLALGASLVYVQTRPLDGHTALAQLDQPKLSPAKADSSVPPGGLPVSAVAPGETVVQPKPAPRTIHPAPTVPVARSPAPVAQPAPDPVVVAAQAPQPRVAPVVITESGPVYQPARQQPIAVCANCGRVEAVTAIERRSPGAGVGAVAGGVLGAVVGNQIGKGSGRAIATILGAVGGGVAGNAIEKNMHRETVFQVQVRMDDGSIRMVEQSSAPAIGAAVIVEGGAMRASDGGAISTLPTPRTAPTKAKVYRSERA